MPNDLRTQIHTFAAQFATEVLKAIRGASLEDILDEATASPSHRASAATPAKRGRGRPKGSKNAAPGVKSTGTGSVVESITAYVTQHPGTSGEAARKALKIDRNKWSPAVAKAIAEKRIRKEGEKRSTKYWGA